MDPAPDRMNPSPPGSDAFSPNRREFLRNALLAAMGTVGAGLLAACSKAEPGAGTPTASATLPTAPIGPQPEISDLPGEISGTLRELGDRLTAEGAAPGLEVYPAGGDFVQGIANYVGLGLVHKDFGPIPQGRASVWITPTDDVDARVSPRGPFVAQWQGYSSPQEAGPPGIHALDVTFDRPGVWTLLVQVDDRSETLLGTGQVTVQAKAQNPASGDRAVASKTPTFDDNRGVDPICTRKPACPMHQVTLAEAIRSGKPTAFLMGTPAFCESRTCAPNLDELLTVREEWSGDANFVHAEVYRDDDPDTIRKQIVSPTFEDWGFTSEPWIYLIDRRGVIADRYEGPVVASRLRRDMMRLLGK